MFPDLPREITRKQMLAIVDREINMREIVYPRRVRDGQMTQSKADFELFGMKAIRQFIADRVDE